VSTATLTQPVSRLSDRPLVDRWAKLALILIVGYLCAGRSFAYLGLPWISLYLGEISLAAFLVLGPRTKRGRWLKVVQRAKRFRRLDHLVVLLICYGGFEALHGIFSGYPVFTAVRDTAFNYYPVFLFLGVWSAIQDPDFLGRAVRALAWWNGCYGLAYALFLSRLPWAMPGTADTPSAVPVFSEPLGSAIAILGLFAYEPKLRRVWHLLALNFVVMFFVQMRAEWVGFCVGLAIFAWCTKRIKHLAIAGALVTALLAVMFITHIHLPAPRGRGGEISVDGIVARAVAPVDRDFAAQLAPRRAVVGYVGTVSWRLFWWASIWHTVHEKPIRAVLGLGYGYPIGDLNPFIQSGTFIQTPHNDFFYALAYSGWLGVLLFVLLQIELVRLLWHGYLRTGQPFGLMCGAALLAESMFGDFFEAPMGAIPFYLLIGAGIACAALSQNAQQRRFPLSSAGSTVLG
jgi:hypothetical protein